MANSNQANNWGCGLLILFFLFALGRCGGDDNDEPESNSSQSTATLLDATQDDEFERESPSGAAAQFDEGETAYVTANSLNGRTNPSTDSPIIAKLPHRSSATVIDRSGDWMKVRSPSGDVWVSSRYVSRYRPSPKPTYTPRPQRFYGSGCPCSGSQVCIGPRGGRYCITSGGNKRYGV